MIHDEASCLAYFDEVVQMLLARYELPMLKRMMQLHDQPEQFALWSAQYRASRESKELLAESQQLAFSLNAWIKDVLQCVPAVKKQDGFLPVYAQLCGHLGLAEVDAMTAYAFTVLENQVLAAVKTIPLGQMSGQRILWQLNARLPAAVEYALALSDEEMSSALPRYAMLSMQHETQYSRLFRS